MIDSLNNAATKIRSHYIAYRVRRTVVVYSKLPSDIWSIILQFVVERQTIIDRIRITIKKRLLDLRPTNSYDIFHKLDTLRLVKKYKNILDVESRTISLALCLHLLERFTIQRHPLKVYLINSALETLVSIDKLSDLRS